MLVKQCGENPTLPECKYDSGEYVNAKKVKATGIPHLNHISIPSWSART